MKRGRTLLVGLVLVGMVESSLAGTYGGGSGTPEDPYQIGTPEHLIALGETPEDYGKCFILTTDIDLSGYTFDRAVIAPDEDDTEDGFQGTTFTGVFDGGGHQVLNLTIHGHSYLGLFGMMLSPGRLLNLELKTVDVYGALYAGGLCGLSGCFGGLGDEYLDGGTISHCGATGIVSAACYVGGLVGSNRVGDISISHTYGTVMGDSCVGGLVGDNGFESTITACHSTCMVTGYDFVGGLVGVNSAGRVSSSCSAGTTAGGYEVGGLCGGNGGRITNCYSTASVSANYMFTGGLVGHNHLAEISTSHATGVVAGNLEVGGLVGLNWGGSISDSHSTGTVTGSRAVGGLAGNNTGDRGEYTEGRIRRCYATGTVFANGDYAGGMVGFNANGSITDSYSTGMVIGNEGVGGLAGHHGGEITASYSIGIVSGQADVGGLVGENDTHNFPDNRGVISGFWDVQTSGLDSSDGGEGRTTAEMKTLSMFTDADWDFINVWDIGEGQTYPYLRTYSAADLNKDHAVNLLDLTIMAEQWMGEHE